MKTLITAILYFLTITTIAQHPVIISSNRYAVDYKKHPGYIEFNNGDKVKGIFEYASDEFPTYNLKSFTSDGGLIKRYKSNDIKEVVLAGSDKSISGKDSTYFKILDRSKRLYRQLTFGKNLEVYDELFNVDERYGLVHYLVIKKNNQLIKFNSSKDFTSWMKENTSDTFKWREDMTAEQIICGLNGIH